MTPAIQSPRLRLLQQQLADNPESTTDLLDDFWSGIEHDGTPMIEPADTEGAMLVTFLVREGDRAIESINLLEPFSWKPQDQRMRQGFEGTDIWYLTWRVRDDLRGSYGFATKYADAEAPDRTADPLARNYEFGAWSDREGNTSVLVMPNAAPLTWRHADEGVPRGTTTQHQFLSNILKNERPVWVHTPASYEKSAGPYRYVVIFDGDEPDHSATEVIDNLVAAGEIPPVIAILVDQIGIRDQELPGNPDFSRAIATELVPWMRDEYNLSTEPGHAALNGGSFGGFCAGYTALHHSDVFGNAIMHSPFSWVHPNVSKQWQERNGDMSADPVGEPADVPLLIQEFRDAELKPIRLWHEVGTVENGPPPARIWQSFGNRWLHDILVLKGYDTVYREYVGGHDDAWWRGTVAEGLTWVFGDQKA